MFSIGLEWILKVVRELMIYLRTSRSGEGISETNYLWSYQIIDFWKNFPSLLIYSAKPQYVSYNEYDADKIS
jgi:hypothetical protein